MRVARCVLYLALLGGLRGVAGAAEWVAMGPMGDGNLHSYDASKLLLEGEEVTYWRKIRFTKPVQAGGGTIVTALFRERVQCKQYTVVALAWFLYDEQNQLRSQSAAADEARPLLPDSIGDVFAARLCALLPPVLPPVVTDAKPKDPLAVTGTIKPVDTPIKPITATPVKPAPVLPTPPKPLLDLPIPPGDNWIVIPGNDEPLKP